MSTSEFPLAQIHVKLAGPKKLVIHPLSDTHVAADRHQRGKLQKRIDYILAQDESHRVICHGDWADIRNKDGKSFAHGVMTPDQEFDELMALLTPLAKANRIDLVMPGNHEDRIKKVVGFDFMAKLAAALGVYQKYSAGPCILRHTFGPKNKVVEGLVHHGFGGGRKPGASFNNLLELGRWKVDIDYVIMGHVHYCGGFKSVYYLGAPAKIHEVTHALTGAYVDHEHYAQNFGLHPSYVGSPRLYVGHDFGDDSLVHVLT